MSDQTPPSPPPEPGAGSPHQPPPGQPPYAPYGPPPPRRRRVPGGPWPWAVGAALILVIAVTVLVVALGGGEEEAKAQTVRFQPATDVGPDPFLEKPAERRGKRKVKIASSSPDVGSGPFGGTGSDLVCDRDLLIESLKARSDRLVEWARVLGVEPTIKAVLRTSSRRPAKPSLRRGLQRQNMAEPKASRSARYARRLRVAPDVRPRPSSVRKAGS